MNKTELMKSTEGYSVATVGNLTSFEGKAFVKDILGTTSVELSFGTLAPGTSVPFFHHHRQNEEVYVVLSGEGVFVLDGVEDGFEAQPMHLGDFFGGIQQVRDLLNFFFHGLISFLFFRIGWLGGRNRCRKSGRSRRFSSS